ncbi:MAG TPA: glycosyltransferase, partial [Chryseosolibacter sp.]
IGTGKNNIGIPVLEGLIKRMARDADITVFQLYTVNKGYRAEGFDLVETYSANPIVKTFIFLRQFRKYQKRRKFQAVHGFWAFPCGFFAVLAASVYRSRSVISLQGGDAISLPGLGYGQLQKWWKRKLVLWSLARVDELISPTRYLIDNLKKFGFRERNVNYIPLGVDSEMFSFVSKPLGKPVRFLHVGNFHPVKDHVTLLKTFQMICAVLPSHLTLIGEGVWESKIKSLAEQLHILDKITFEGLRPHEELPGIYHRSDVLIHTSLSEGHPIVVEEAMSCGVIVCGTSVGLLYDLPECCIAAPVGDFHTLSRKILELLSDPQRLDAIRSRARRWANENTMVKTAESIKHIYRLTAL